YVTAHPNAGLPTAFGEYALDPATLSPQIRARAEAGCLTLVCVPLVVTPAHMVAQHPVAASYPLAPNPLSAVQPIQLPLPVYSLSDHADTGDTLMAY
ncbi:hypothetical protein, partial [Salmonella enterica]|uniref:hypothetical protein n=1 Tax=Salmonella enterica TaxID=28901 RepID=UPI00398C7041